MNEIKLSIRKNPIRKTEVGVCFTTVVKRKNECASMWMELHNHAHRRGNPSKNLESNEVLYCCCVLEVNFLYIELNILQLCTTTYYCPLLLSLLPLIFMSLVNMNH